MGNILSLIADSGNNDAYQKGFEQQQARVNAPIQTAQAQQNLQNTQTQDDTQKFVLASNKIKSLQDAAINLTPDNYAIQKNLLESHGIVQPGMMPAQFDPAWKDATINKLAQAGQQLDLQAKQAEVELKQAHAKFFNTGMQGGNTGMLMNKLMASNPNMTPEDALAFIKGGANQGILYQGGGASPYQGYGEAKGNIAEQESQGKELGKTRVKTSESAASSQETFDRLNKNLDAMIDVNKDVPQQTYFAPASAKAAISQNFPSFDNQKSANAYKTFNKINQQQVINGLSELVKSGQIRGNQYIEKIINQGYAIDENASPAERENQIETLRAELGNVKKAATNVSNKMQGKPAEPYADIPTNASQNPAEKAASLIPPDENIPNNGVVRPQLSKSQALQILRARGHKL